MNYYSISKNKILVLFGPSQAGKSSFVNTLHSLRDKDIAKVGEDDGESTTSDVRTFEVKNKTDKGSFSFTIVDVPGLHDTRNIPGGEIRTMIASELRDSKKVDDNISAILVFESLYSDAKKLQDTLMNVEKMFGADAMASVIVLFTKEEFGSSKKKQGLEKQCRDHYPSLPFLYWKNKCESYHPSQSEYNSQVNELRSILGETQSFSIAKQKEKLEARILEKQIELQRNSSPLKKMIDVTEYKTERREKRRGTLVERHLADWCHPGYETVYIPQQVQKEIEMQLPLESFRAKAEKEVSKEIRNSYVSKSRNRDSEAPRFISRTYFN